MMTPQPWPFGTFKGRELDPNPAPICFDPQPPTSRAPGAFILGDLGSGKGRSLKSLERPT